MRFVCILALLFVVAFEAPAQTSTISLNITLSDIQSVKLSERAEKQWNQSKDSRPGTEIQVLNTVAYAVHKVDEIFLKSEPNELSNTFLAGNPQVARPVMSSENLKPPASPKPVIAHHIYYINPK